MHCRTRRRGPGRDRRRRASVRKVLIRGYRLVRENAAKVRCLTFLSCICACCALPIPGRSPNPSAKTPFIHLAALWLAMLSVHVNTFLFNGGHELTNVGRAEKCPRVSPSSNDYFCGNPPALSGRYQALVLVRRLCAATISSRACRRNRGGGAYGAYRCATNGGGGWGPGHTGNVGGRDLRFGRFSPRAPAPVAPPLPARRATHRSKPDGSAREPRRSMFPSTCRLR